MTDADKVMDRQHVLSYLADIWFHIWISGFKAGSLPVEILAFADREHSLVGCCFLFIEFGCHYPCNHASQK